MRRLSRRATLLASSSVLAVVAVVGVVLYYLVATGRQNETEPVPEAVVAELHGHRAPILSCAFSPDSTILATASADATVRIWDTSTFQLKTTLVGHTADIQDIAFSPDGKYLLSASWDCSVRVWETATWQLATVIDRRPHESRSVRFSPDGASFAVGGGKGPGSIQVYDSATWQLRWNGQGTESCISRLVYLPAGRTVVTADEGWLTLWDNETGQILDRVLVGTVGACFINEIVVDADPSELLLHYDGGKIAKWDLATKRSVFEESSPNGTYTGFAFSPDRKLLARMWRRRNDFYGELQLLSGVGGEVLARGGCRNSYLSCICFSSDGKYIAVGGEWDTFIARVWDVEKLRPDPGKAAAR
jgi:WD40 repeat protein